jgi:hypothetical protein
MLSAGARAQTLRRHVPRSGVTGFTIASRSLTEGAQFPESTNLRRIRRGRRPLPIQRGAARPYRSATAPETARASVSDNSRIFVNFPRWGDRVEYTVAEVKDGKTLPYPSADINR